jgi:large subunit ribosomal protein L37Ae
MKTKKVGSTGRWGARYGLKIRKKVLEIERLQKCKHKCPFCFKFAVKRLALGIWYCKHCEVKFAGRAYEPGITGKPMLEVPAALLEIERQKEEAKKNV